MFKIRWVIRVWLALLSVFLLTACNPGTTVVALGPGFVLDTAGSAVTQVANRLDGGHSSAFKQKKIIFDGEWKGVGYIRSGNNENCRGKPVPIHFKVEDGVAISLLRGSNLKFREPVDQDGDLRFVYSKSSSTDEVIGVMRKNDMQFWGRLYDGYGKGNFSLGGICKSSKWSVKKVDELGDAQIASDHLDSEVRMSGVQYYSKEQKTVWVTNLARKNGCSSDEIDVRFVKTDKEDEIYTVQCDDRALKFGCKFSAFGITDYIPSMPVDHPMQGVPFYKTKVTASGTGGATGRVVTKAACWTL